MGSGAETARETAAALRRAGEKRGRPSGAPVPAIFGNAFIGALPDTCRAIAVLEQTKEPGASGEPLYLDVVEALAQASRPRGRASIPKIVGGRYGLSSKDFSPAMAKAVFDEI
jgi:pyruvate-ferredoxin/flavodoxin oxidoreductase